MEIHQDRRASYCLPSFWQVVKMRKDVKKARVLTIRRLTRHIGKLKLKKSVLNISVHVCVLINEIVTGLSF